MTILLERAMESLSTVVNVQRGLLHPLDDSRAKELFVELIARGERFDYSDIFALAVRFKWPEKHAKDLANLAVRISNGNKVQISNPRDWGQFILDKITDETNANET